jgi:hypothetical protein
VVEGAGHHARGLRAARHHGRAAGHRDVAHGDELVDDAVEAFLGHDEAEAGQAQQHGAAEQQGGEAADQAAVDGEAAKEQHGQPYRPPLAGL